jgi:hypothetical protein
MALKRHKQAMTHILLFARDPGGANALLPLLPELKRKGYRFSLLGKETAFTLFHQGGFDSLDLMEQLTVISSESILTFLKNENPDLLITGTSSDDFTERYFWQAAETLKIPSMAVFDFWGNYGLRFSPYLVWDLNLYNQNKSYLTLPSRICMMDEFARQGMLADGIPEEHLAVTGQPYLQKLLHRKKALSVTHQLDLKRRIFGPEETFAITFASQSFTETYQVTERGDCHWGYTEQTILLELLAALKTVADETNRKITLLIKPHPKNELSFFEEIVYPFTHPSIELRLSTEDSVWEVIEASDLICSMFSMMLVEAVILGKPILSIQIGLKQEDPFILSCRGLSESVLSQSELVLRLKEILHKSEMALTDFELVDNAVESVLRIMEQLLCLQPLPLPSLP